MVDVDVAKCKQAGISPSDVLTALQGYIGGMYSSNFNRFGKLYRVMIQAEPSARVSPESLNNIKIRTVPRWPLSPTSLRCIRCTVPTTSTASTCLPLSRSTVTRPTVTVRARPSRALEEVAAETLPVGYGYEFSGMTREEQSSSSGTTAIIFVLCLVFVYLLLSAQYESYVLPLSVILSIPFGLAGSFIFALIMGVENNIYLQIALIMLIGLLAKNAILIVEFALDRRRTGMPIINAAIDGAAARLRPILMTSLAMVIGLLPMMFASGCRSQW